MKRDIQMRMKNILKKVVACKTKGHDVFFEYSPHIQKICVRVYLWGWKAKVNPDFMFEEYVEPYEYRTHEQILESLDNIIKQLSDVYNMKYKL